MKQMVSVVCREGKLEDLLMQLASHRLDIVLADEPAPASAKVRAFNHFLGRSPVAICASPALAGKLRKGFPKSLDGQPALLTSENTSQRRSLDHWFKSLGIQPVVVAEFEDPALLKIMAAEGRGFIPVPETVEEEETARYGFERIGLAEQVVDSFYAITAERRITHPAVALLTAPAK